MPLKIGKTVLMTLNEAEREFNIPAETLWRAIKRGTLKSLYYSGRNFVKVEDVKRWIETHYRPDMAARVRVRWEKEKKGKKRKRKKEGVKNDSAVGVATIASSNVD